LATGLVIYATGGLAAAPMLTAAETATVGLTELEIAELGEAALWVEDYSLALVDRVSSFEMSVLSHVV